MALNFEIKETYDPTQLIIYDTSDWTGLGAAQVSILAPDCITPIIIPLNKNLVNTFTPSQFTEITTDYFPDGVYEITVEDTLQTTSAIKKHLRVTRVLNEIDKQYISCLSECSYLTEEFRKLIYDLNLYIDAAKAHLRNDFLDKTDYFFETLLKATKELAECKNCK